MLQTTDENCVFTPGHNTFTTTRGGETDVLIFHARNYREIIGDPLYDSNRHTYARVIRWKADGIPEFDEPQ